MMRDGEKPKVGPTARTLGVRVPPNPYVDSQVNADGTVEPGCGGMSVSPDVQSLPKERVPPRYKRMKPNAHGHYGDICWQMGEGSFADGQISDRLVLRVDSDDHGVIEPAYRMPLDEYHLALAATQDYWIAVNHEIAAVFFGEAVRQSPADIEMLSCYLRSLIKCGHLDGARRKARFIANKEVHPFTLLLAADVLFDCLDLHGDSAAPSDLRMIAELVNRGMKNIGAIQNNSWRAAVVSSALFSKALCHEILGERSDAIAVAAQAEQLIPLASSLAVVSQVTDQMAERNGSLREQLQDRRRIPHEALEKPDAWLCAA